MAIKLVLYFIFYFFLNSPSIRRKKNVQKENETKHQRTVTKAKI